MQDISAPIGKKSYAAVSIILPVNPEYPHYKEAKGRFAALLKKAEHQLNDDLPPREADAIIRQLRKTTKEIDFSKLSLGLSVLVAPGYARVTLLPFAPRERMMVDHSFDVRDLIYASKLSADYVLIDISENRVRAHFGYGSRIFPHQLDWLKHGVQDVTGDKSLAGREYKDIHAFDENNIHKYIQDIDELIGSIVKKYQTPVIIAAPGKLGSFLKNATRYSTHIAGYLEGNFEHLSDAVLAEKAASVLKKVFADKQKRLLVMLDEAVSNGKYASGIEQVWRAVAEDKGLTLLIEKNFSCPAVRGNDAYTILTQDIDRNNPSLMHDAADDVIEETLKKGGQVYFLDNGTLLVHRGIALIERF